MTEGKKDTSKVDNSESDTSEVDYNKSDVPEQFYLEKSQKIDISDPTLIENQHNNEIDQSLENLHEGNDEAQMEEAMEEEVEHVYKRPERKKNQQCKFLGCNFTCYDMTHMEIHYGTEVHWSHDLSLMRKWGVPERYALLMEGNKKNYCPFCKTVTTHALLTHLRKHHSKKTADNIAVLKYAVKISQKRMRKQQ